MRDVESPHMKASGLAPWNSATGQRQQADLGDIDAAGGVLTFTFTTRGNSKTVTCPKGRTCDVVCKSAVHSHVCYDMRLKGKFRRITCHGKYACYHM